jgi:hypothetical protein
MTTNERPDPYERVAAEALMLRALHSYRFALQRAKDDGVDVSAASEPPPYTELSQPYDELIVDMYADKPDKLPGVLAYLDLAAAIIGDELVWRYEEEGGIIASERDLAFAMELMGTARNWLNKRDLADFIRKISCRAWRHRGVAVACQGAPLGDVRGFPLAGRPYSSRHMREAIRIPRRIVTTSMLVRTACRSTRAILPRGHGIQNVYRSPATVVKTEVRFEPTVPMIVTAAIEIRAAIKPYSIAVAPSSFLKSLVSRSNMKHSSGVADPPINTT